MPSRELQAVSFYTDVIVLAPARTVKGLSFEVYHRELSTVDTRTNVIVLIVPPTADTLRTVKSSRSRSNSKEMAESLPRLFRRGSRSRSNSKVCHGRHFLLFEGYCPRTICRRC